MHVDSCVQASSRRQRTTPPGGVQPHKLLTHKRSSSFGPDVVAIRGSDSERSVSAASASCSEVSLSSSPFITVLTIDNVGWIGGVTVRASDLRSSGRGFRQGGRKPGKPGILRDFSEHGKLGEFSGNSVQPRGKL